MGFRQWWSSRREVQRLLRERREIASRTQVDRHFLGDPIEFDPELADVFRDADELVAAEWGDRPVVRGSCHVRWRIRERVLRERFGVTWFSPSAMNPGARFD